MPPDWHPRLPDRVPAPPDVSVGYFDVEDREPVGGTDSTVSVGRVRDGDWTHRVALERPAFPGPIHTGIRERFRAAADEWATLDHPGVVAVLGHGVDPRPWLAVEYADGGSLPDRDLPLEFPEALWVARTLAAAAEHAHERGVRHRAIRPGSVLFRSTSGDAWPAPKVAGWGVARAVADLGRGVARLAPAYAAPEQVDRDRGPPDERTDVYRIGAVSYLLATGDPPFPRPFSRARKTILAGEPDPPSSVAPVPGAFDGVLSRALATDPGDRYDSAADLRVALDDLAADYGDGRVTVPGAATGSEGDDAGGDRVTIDRRTALLAGAGVLGTTAVAAGASALFPVGGSPEGTAGNGPAERPGSGGRRRADAATDRGGVDPASTAVTGIPDCGTAGESAYRIASVSAEKRSDEDRTVLEGTLEYVGDADEDASGVIVEVTGTFRDGDGMSLGVRSETIYFDPEESSRFRLTFGNDGDWREVESVALGVRPSACLGSRE